MRRDIHQFPELFNKNCSTLRIPKNNITVIMTLLHIFSANNIPRKTSIQRDCFLGLPEFFNSRKIVCQLWEVQTKTSLFISVLHIFEHDSLLRKTSMCKYGRNKHKQLCSLLDFPELSNSRSMVVKPNEYATMDGQLREDQR